MIAGIAITIFCLIYFSPRVNAVDSDPMTVSPGGGMVAEWPIFIGILTTFVGAVFFYISLTEKKVK